MLVLPEVPDGLREIERGTLVAWVLRKLGLEQLSIALELPNPRCSIPVVLDHDAREYLLAERAFGRKVFVCRTFVPPPAIASNESGHGIVQLPRVAQQVRVSS